MTQFTPEPPKPRSGLLLLSFLLALLSTPLLAAEDTPLLRQLADRAEIQEVAYRYITALDTRDADLYVSVFTEDAEYDVEGQVYRGHEQLRGIIEGLQRSREAAIAEGRPVVDLYHTNINPVIELVGANEARFQAYWQTLRRAEDNSMRIGGMGRIEDTLVRTAAGWKIKTRVLTNFVPRQ
jgi:3-phenylpropionate/cinnamic acid dioxygenase small subunit